LGADGTATPLTNRRKQKISGWLQEARAPSTNGSAVAGVDSRRKRVSSAAHSIQSLNTFDGVSEAGKRDIAKGDIEGGFDEDGGSQGAGGRVTKTLTGLGELARMSWHKLFKKGSCNRELDAKHDNDNRMREDGGEQAPAVGPGPGSCSAYAQEGHKTGRPGPLEEEEEEEEEEEVLQRGQAQEEHAEADYGLVAMLCGLDGSQMAMPSLPERLAAPVPPPHKEEVALGQAHFGTMRQPDLGAKYPNGGWDGHGVPEVFAESSQGGEHHVYKV
jgi:hypothetical protein